MTKLAKEFNLSDQGLAKICKKFDVPRPPRGYWAKLEVGKKVIQEKLPEKKAGTPETIVIYVRSETQPKPEKEPRLEIEAKIPQEIAIPDTLRSAHPIVKGWIEKHRLKQAKRRADSREWRIGWHSMPLLDLSERDLYRLRVTSAFLKISEKEGVTIEKSWAKGALTLIVEDEKVEVVILEKMIKTYGQDNDDIKNWSAYADCYQSGLRPSGFLRFEIKTYVPDIARGPWIETKTHKAEKILPTLVEETLRAGPALVKRKKEWEEAERRRQKEAMERLRLQQAKELDDKRWATFMAMCTDADSAEKLRAFIERLKVKLAVEGDIQVGDLNLSEWIAWAEQRTRQLDPFEQSLEDLFGNIAQTKHYSF
ncbi:hypothetical protein [Stappia stellulata]|uniref:hypothetical protein n=1 Tax=Stappia stellulata TaxID=71235 RepID=UPI00040A8388|nr:hypothetical protein [Stappia stellulata]